MGIDMLQITNQLRFYISEIKNLQDENQNLKDENKKLKIKLKKRKDGKTSKNN
tara:strand:+ start:1178 stop:1336 length:159 start_codon:yes stop_codon:yes gene_type:complete